MSGLIEVKKHQPYGWNQIKLPSEDLTLDKLNDWAISTGLSFIYYYSVPSCFATKDGIQLDDNSGRLVLMHSSPWQFMPAHIIFSFTNADDAVMFKMRWC